MLGSFYLSRYGAAAEFGGLALPGAGLVGAFNWTWLLALSCPVFIAFLAPTGRPASPRWGIVLQVEVVLFAIVSVVFALGDPAYQLGTEAPRMVPNPLYIPALGPVYDFFNAAFVIYLVLFGAGAAALVARFRASRGAERQQLKWILAGTVAMFALIGASNALPDPFGDICFALAMPTLPAAIGIAILRFRLYDIDRLISRTIAWALVTGTLAGVFAGLVVGLEQLLSPATGGSTLAIAASTLVAFALFSPLRRRVQALVDRRFDRARYDADRLVESLGARLRNETDPRRVRRAIEETVGGTLAPSTVTVWTREQ
jgi:hypothetical protein